MVVAVAALAAACGRGGRETFRGAPLVLVSIDTLRADHLPAYGYGKVETPALEGLRRDGILFANAYSHCPLTLPSHTSLLTGLLPPQHGVRDNLGYTLDAKAHPTLATLLKGRGYATGAAVSAFVLRGATGLEASFDTYDDAITAPAGSEAAASAQRSGYETESRAEGFLDGVGSRPFFLFFHIYEPHLPYDPPEPFKSRYALPYDGEVAAADDIVGRLVASLKKRGLYDRSLVVLVSDHGEGLGDHGEADHGILLYREVLKVPLLVKLPGSKRKGETIERPVGLVDVVPTVSELLELDPPKGLPGSSLLEATGSQKGVYSETYFPRIHLGWSELRSLVDARYHLIEGPDPELYAVRDDPEEKTSVLRGHEALASTMRAALEKEAGTFTGPAAPDPEALEKLRALGYLGGGVEELPKGGSLPDPKAHIAVVAGIQKGFALAAAGRNAEALAVLGGLLKENPQITDVQIKVGLILLESGRAEEALAAFGAACKVSPSLAGVVAPSVARAEVELGRLPEAERAARVALGSSPVEGHALLGRVALARGDLQAAEDEAAALQKIPAGLESGALLAAEVRARQGRYAEALEILKGAAPRDHAPIRDFQFLLGDVFASLNRLGEAEAAFRTESELYPANSEAFARLAIVTALERRNVGEVDAILERMEKANPGPATEALAAKTLDSLGDHRGAEAWRRRARARPGG
jgi:arylsulfatase A-like enzyme/tetratricopeptide (TPR) repeat protein